MTFHAFDLWVAVITVSALGGLLLGPLGRRVRSISTAVRRDRRKAIPR